MRSVIWIYCFHPRVALRPHHYRTTPVCWSPVAQCGLGFGRVNLKTSWLEQGLRSPHPPLVLPSGNRWDPGDLIGRRNETQLQSNELDSTQANVFKASWFETHSHQLSLFRTKNWGLAVIWMQCHSNWDLALTRKWRSTKTKKVLPFTIYTHSDLNANQLLVLFLASFTIYLKMVLKCQILRQYLWTVSKLRQFPDLVSKFILILCTQPPQKCHLHHTFFLPHPLYL